MILFIILFILVLSLYARFHISKANVVKYAISFIMKNRNSPPLTDTIGTSASEKEASRGG